MSERIAVVDGRNRFLRWASRDEVHRDQRYHRSAHVLLFDSHGRLHVQRRHRRKLTWPFHWDSSCAGHVEEDDYRRGPDDDLEDVYAAVARRELGEELGVDVPLHLYGVFPPTPGVHYEFIACYRGVSDGPFRLQAEEVEELRTVELTNLARWVETGCEPVTHTLAYFVKQLQAAG